MGRSDYRHFRTTCKGGINQNAETASPEECADARNVWAPNGRVVSRPGYWGRAFVHEAASDTAAFSVILKETPLGTFAATATLDNLGVGKRWLVGLPAIPAEANYPLGIWMQDVFVVANNNANDMAAMLEYWNGTEWVRIDFAEVSAATGLLAATHLGNVFAATDVFYFPTPRDFALSTINGSSAYWLRFTLEAVNGSLAFDAATAVDAGLGVVTLTFNYTTAQELAYVVAVQFPNSPRYLSCVTVPAGGSFHNTPSLIGPTVAAELGSVAAAYGSHNPDPPSVAVITAANEFYVAYGKTVTVHKASPVVAADTAALATTETADFAVGSGAPYSPDYIAQRSAFPDAKYILFHQNRLWLATDTTVSWSAPVPYHRVLPLLSEEPITGAGTITGLAHLGEQVVVFTENSIWIMVLRGINAFGLSEFIPVRRVSGIGCLSNASVQQINGELIFLGRDGLYAFNGVAARKVSARDGTDRLEEFFASVNPSRRSRAVGIDWKAKGHYLLGISVDGSDVNNRVLAWDYENDRFWIWDDLEAAGWLFVQNALCFFDRGGRVFELERGHTDNGATITSWVTTERANYPGRSKITIREVAVNAEQMAAELTVKVLANDADDGTTGTLLLRDPTEVLDTALVVDTDSWTLPRRRLKRLDFQETCNHAQVQVRHTQKGKEFKLGEIDIGYEIVGTR